MNSATQTGQPLVKVCLGDVSDITMGQSPDSVNLNTSEQGLPFLQGCAEFGRKSPQTAVYCNPPLRISKPESILISVRAPVGTLNWGEQSYCIGRGLAAIRAINEVADTGFLLYAISDNVHYLHRRSQGSTFLAVGGEDLKSFPVPSFRIEAQHKIARILGTIDQAIEKTQVLIDKYQQIKAGLMHDLFTRGIGPDGQLRPCREQSPELYQQTPIGWIPKEWEFAPIGKYVKSVQYGISTSLDDKASGIPVLRMNNIQSNSFDVSEMKYSRAPEAYKVKLSVGDVLYNRTNSIEHVGKTAIWKDELPECSFASYLVRLNLITESVFPEYFSHWMSQVASQNALRVYATPGVQQVNINPTNLQRVIISLPTSMDEQLEIARRIDSIDCRIEKDRLLLAKFQKQKSGLMHDLLTGEVQVRVESEEERAVETV
jgi:type I restriction enzyme, S subunit